MSTQVRCMAELAKASWFLRISQKSALYLFYTVVQHTYDIHKFDMYKFELIHIEDMYIELVPHSKLRSELTSQNVSTQVAARGTARKRALHPHKTAFYFSKSDLYLHTNGQCLRTRAQWICKSVFYLRQRGRGRGGGGGGGGGRMAEASEP